MKKNMGIGGITKKQLLMVSLGLFSIGLASFVDTQTVNAANITPETVSNDVDVTSGVFGTANWNIDSNGVLHIQAGDLGSMTELNGEGYGDPNNPWIKYNA